MSTHPLLPQFLRLAYGCMACDGEIAPSEVSCLRSIAIQMGQPGDDVAADLDAIGEEFAAYGDRMVTNAKTVLTETGLSHRDAILLLDLLVQLVEADGEVRDNEIRYIRDLVRELDLDRAALRTQHPEWRSYLAESIRYVVRERGPRYIAAEWTKPPNGTSSE